MTLTVDEAMDRVKHERTCLGWTYPEGGVAHTLVAEIKRLRKELVETKKQLRETAISRGNMLRCILEDRGR